MKRMLEELKERGYQKTSLAVQKANYAVKMYKNVGFEIIDENEEECIMRSLVALMKYMRQFIDRQRSRYMSLIIILD